MPIRLLCPGCSKKLNIVDELAGKRAKCPGCASIVNIPKMAKLVTDEAPARPSEPPRPPKNEPNPFENFGDYDNEPPRPRSPRSRPPRPLKGLEGLSPDYRIELGRWYELSGKHIGRIIGPSIGFLFVFFGIYLLMVLLHYAIVGFLLDPFVFPAMAMGLHIVCQRQIMRKEWSFGTFFSGFRYVWPLFARAILLGLLPVVMFIPLVLFLMFCNAVFDDPKPAIVPVLALLAALITICAITYVFIRLCFFSHLLIVDRDCGPIEALKGSWLLSRGHFWGLFGSMILILSCVYLVTFATLGLGMFFALPRAVLMLNAGYLLVAGSEPIPGVDKPIEPARKGGAILAIALGGAVIAAIVFIVVGAAIAISMNAEHRQRYDDRMFVDSARTQVALAQVERDQKVEEEQQTRDIIAFFRDGGYWAITVSEPEALQPLDEGVAPRRGGIEPRPVKVLVLGPSGMLNRPPAVAIGQPFVPFPSQARLMEQLRDIQREWGSRWRSFTTEFEHAMARGDVEAVVVEVMPPKSKLDGGSGRGSHVRLPAGTPVPMDQAKSITGSKFLNLTVERAW